MRRATIAITTVAVVLGTACSAAGDAAFEKTLESQLGYDVEIYYDEDGERQARPVDGAAALEIEFDRGRLDGLPVPDGFVAADDGMSTAQTVQVQFLAQDEDDVRATADAFQAALEADGWTVDRDDRENGSVGLRFERDVASGSALVAIDDMLGTVMLSINYTRDSTPGGGLEVPEPDGLLEREERGGATEFTIEGTDIEALARAYAAQLETAGWTIDSVELGEEGVGVVVFNGGGTLGIVQVFPGRDEGQSILVVRFP